MRVPKGSTITITTEPFDGAPTDPEVTVSRADGTVLSPAPTGAVDHWSVQVPLTAADHLDELDTLTVTVTATVGDATEVQVLEVDVVGSHWVTLGALRGERNLDDEARYPTATLRAVRDEWEDWIEDVCNRRFTPGYGIDRRRIGSTDRFVLPSPDVTTLRAVLVDGVAADLDDFTLGPGGTVVYRSLFNADTTIEVHYEHGQTRPPAKLVREVRKAIARELTRRNANTPNDAISETSPEGGPTIRYSTPDPDRGRYTGILSLDPVIHELRYTEPGFA